VASETSICNQALSWLGASLILSIDDGTTNADLCKVNYDELRDAVLNEALWSFATKRYKWIPTIDVPAFGYGKSFLIPSEVITIIEVRDDSVFANGTSNLDWRREGNRVVANVDAVYAKCIYRVTDTSQFSPLFIQALATRLAAELAPAITESNTKTQLMWAMYDQKITLAMSMDGMQGRNDRTRNRQLTTLVR